MTTVPLHPALVHVPLGLAFALPLVTAGLALALWRGLVPRRAWLVAVALQAMLLAGGAAALRTGEGDEKRVGSFVAKSLVEAHEHAAETFLWGAAAVFGLTAAVLAVPRRATALCAAVATAGTLLVGALAYRTGKAGGELVYVNGAARAYTATTIDEARRVASKDRSEHRR
jgi:hypothetical protein